MRITDNDDKKKKSQRVVSRLEKDLADATKELQTLATPSKMMVTVFGMVVMLSVQKRCEKRQAGGRAVADGGVVLTRVAALGMFSSGFLRSLILSFASLPSSGCCALCEARVPRSAIVSC